MVADAAVSREQQSLQETLAASQRESVSAGTPPQTNQSGDATDEQQPDGTLGKFIEAITEFFEEAEKNVSAHPAAHVIGGVVVGILIGRLLGRRQEQRHD